MNKTILTFTREEIKKGLAKLTEKHRLVFKRLYSHDNPKKPINDIVDTIPETRLSWALTQIENTLNANKENK